MLYEVITRKKESVPSCPDCGTTLEDIRRKKQVGCASCYREFRAEISALMRSEGFESGYEGTLPEKLEAFRQTPPDPENLRKELQRAIDAEDYELAAYYRDRIRALGGNS